MQTTEYHSKQSKLHADEYINAKTGETLDSEMKNDGAAYTKEPTGKFSIKSDNYVSFDSGAIEYLLNALNKPDVSRVFYMSKMLHGECSVLYQKNNRPHTSETLYTVLDMSHDEFYKMVKRLIKAGVLAYCVCAPSGYIEKVYMLNPYIARKKRVLSCEILTFFSDVTKSKKK